VLLEEGYYRLCPTLVRVETDVNEFDAFYQRGLHLEKSDRMVEAVAQYEKAVDLYRGDYLVEDLYEDWTMVERERLISALIDILDRLATHYRNTAQYQDCLRICHRLLSKDPCYEKGHALIMKCYASLGFCIRASHQYQVYQHLLSQKLDKAPSPEMQALHDTILASRRIDRV
jgi:DNA-binding SARP family transcriptional activator